MFNQDWFTCARPEGRFYHYTADLLFSNDFLKYMYYYKANCKIRNFKIIIAYKILTVNSLPSLHNQASFVYLFLNFDHSL